VSASRDTVRTLATVAIGQGRDVRTVAGRLGHANPAMTLRVYAHVFASADRAVADALGELLQEVARGGGMRPIVVRDEEAPDETVVVVRGGEMNGDTVRRTAADAFDEFGIYTVSVFLTLDATVDEICRERPELQRYGKVRLTTAGRLRSLGFALVPTLDRPHYDVVLPDLANATLDRLELGFDRPIANPGRAQ
jgi:hypothetical protein